MLALRARSYDHPSLGRAGKRWVPVETVVKDQTLVLGNAIAPLYSSRVRGIVKTQDTQPLAILRSEMSLVAWS
jgi:hypothetical protein